MVMYANEFKTKENQKLAEIQKLTATFILVNNTRQSGLFSVDNFITVNPSNCRFSFP